MPENSVHVQESALRKLIGKVTRPARRPMTEGQKGIIVMPRPPAAIDIQEVAPSGPPAAESEDGMTYYALFKEMQAAYGRQERRNNEYRAEIEELHAEVQRLRAALEAFDER